MRAGMCLALASGMFSRSPLVRNTLGLVLGVLAGQFVMSPTVQATVGAPVISLLSPIQGTDVRGHVSLYAAADSSGVVSLKFQLDGKDYGGLITAGLCQMAWDTTTSPDGLHTITAVAVDEF